MSYCGGWVCARLAGKISAWHMIGRLVIFLRCHEVSEEIMNCNRISISVYLLDVLRGVFARCHCQGCVAATGTS
jgi:hypothetical protein